MSKSFVPAVRGAKKFKIFPDDLARIYKITKRTTPSIPSYYGKQNYVQETDIDSETCEGAKLWTIFPYWSFILIFFPSQILSLLLFHLYLPPLIISFFLLLSPFLLICLSFSSLTYSLWCQKRSVFCYYGVVTRNFDGLSNK